MEGLSPIEPLTTTPDQFLGVDLTEYYGGESFAEASEVIVSQLKYSTRHSNTAWTIARLRAENEKSVLRRLADILSGFMVDFDRSEVVCKLRIRLISNQPAARPLIKALGEAQAFLASQPKATQTATLLKRVSTATASTLTQLKTVSGLKSVEFTDFVRVLDLSGCGTDSRAFQRLRLMRELSHGVTHDRAATVRGLYDIVMHEAQPERSHSRGLRRADVLAALEVVNEGDLFPSPSKISAVGRLVVSSNAQELASTLLRAPNRQVLAHGDAGVGKTTTVSSLPQHLPPQSTVIVYDCFGGGEYLATGEARHTPQRFIRQVVNELAIQCGTPFLLRLPQDLEELWRYFRRTIDAAATIVGEQGGVLVIAVDAADNAVLAARMHGTFGFMPGLWSLTLHAHVRLLITARTHRINELGENQATAFELRGFDEVASGQYLRLSLPEAGDLESHAFHVSSNGNPRVQTYALDRLAQGADLDDVLAAVQRTPGRLFEELVDAAIKLAPDPSTARVYTATLVCLSRPVRLQVFADVVGLTLPNAVIFCRAFSYGVVINQDQLTFRDEDFETYLRDQFSAPELVASHSRLADYFQGRAETDVYAAKVLAQHLWASQRFPELIALALADHFPALTDALVRTEVRRERLLLGLQAAQMLNEHTTSLKIALILAEVLRADDALTAVVQEYPELAARFGDPAGVSRLYLDSQNQHWLGPAHMRIAALLARDEAWRTEALWHLDMADAWTQRWMQLPENKRRMWDFTAHHVASEAEALYRLFGAEEARRFIGQWRPPEFVSSVVDELAQQLIPSLDPAEVQAQLVHLQLPGIYEAPFLASLYRTGYLPERTWVKRVARQLEKSKELKWRPSFQDGSWSWALWFCLLCAAHGLEADLTQGLIERYQPRTEGFGVRLRGSLESQDQFYRFRALERVVKGEELALEDLLPARYKDAAQQSGGEGWEYREVLNPFVPLYALWGQAAAHKIEATELDQALRDLLTQRQGKTHWYGNSQDLQFSTWAAISADAVLLTPGGNLQLLSELAEVALSVSPRTAPSIWVDLATRLVSRSEGVTPGLLLLERAANEIERRDLPARERWTFLLQCASIATPFGSDLGEALYTQGMKAAESLDDDTALLLSTSADLAIRIAPTMSGTDARSLAVRLARAVETHAPFVSDEDHLPIRLILDAVTHLDPVAGLALCSRWDDEGRQVLGRMVPTVVITGIKNAMITPADGLALLRHAGEKYDPTDIALEGLSRVLAEGPRGRARLQHLFADLSYWIRRDLPQQDRAAAARKAVAWSASHSQLQLPGVKELNTLLAFLSSLVPAPVVGVPPPQPAEQDSAGEEVGGSTDDLLERLSKIWRRQLNEQSVDEFFRAARLSLTFQDRTIFLSALINFDGLGVFDLPIGKVLAQLALALQDWRNSPAVQQWARDHLAGFIEQKLPTLIRYDQGFANLALIVRMPLLSAPIQTLLNAVAVNVNDITARMVYAIVSEAASQLPAQEAHHLIVWSLERFERAMGLPSIPIPELPTSVPAALAMFYWAALGHPDKRVRWQALHAARSTALAPDSTFLNDFLGVIRSHTAGAFRSSALEFYWMSARAYAALLLARLAEDNPSLVIPHLQDIIDLALDPQVPQIQVRVFCRRAVLRVIRDFPDALPAALHHRLRDLGEPTICADERAAPRHDARDWNSTEHRFTFDTVDTLPYWFRPLGEVFGLTSAEVAERAEEWICDRWGYQDVDQMADARRLQDSRYEDTSNRHGSVPTVETLHTYLEFNAMLCVAGALIESDCVVKPRSDEQPDASWRYWLSHYIDTSPDWWLDDLRQPTPLQPEFWENAGDLEPWLSKPYESFEEALGIGQACVEWLCVGGNTEAIQADREGQVSIRSALVSTAGAPSLLRALSTIKDSDDFRLPYEGDEKELDDGVFDLKGWLTYDYRGIEGIDEHDPIAREVSPMRAALATRVLEVLQLQPDAQKLSFKDPIGRVAARYEIWNDDLERKESTDPGSSGQRLWFRLEALLAFLRHEDRSLVLEVKLRRSRLRRGSGGERDYDHGTSRIFILDGIGRLQTLDRCRDFRRNHRP